MKVLAFNSSPNRDGNTAIMLKEALSVMEKSNIDTELIHIRPSGLLPCAGCNFCRESGQARCALKDPLNDWLKKIFAADGILLGSPTYFFGVHPSMKCLIDRVGYITRGKIRTGNNGFLRHKVGGAIAVDASSGAPQTVQAMQAFFMVTEMIVPGGIYWPIGKGTAPGDVLKDKAGLAYARNLGENMAWLIQKIHG